MRIFIHRTRDADWQSYANDLKRLELDNSAFDAVISRLRSDSSIKQPEMHQIATEYLGYGLAKSKSKSELLQKIVQTQMVTARQTARSANLGHGGGSW